MTQQLTSAHAEQIIKYAFKKAEELNLAPLTVVIVDTGGHMKAMHRADSATFFRPQIAFGKAWGAIAMGMDSRTLFSMGEDRPMFMNSLINLSEHRLVPVPGGVLIKNGDGDMLGAVGISGDTSDNDEICAVAGVEAAGLIAEYGK